VAVGFPAGITQQYIVNNAQAKLAALRRALEDVADFYAWLSAYAVADLEAAPVSMDAVSAQAVFNAFADAHALSQVYLTGLPPGTYPQPGSAYVYATSQRVIIGPLT
jgi:hypothetical protein